MVNSVGLNSAVSSVHKGFDSLQSNANQIANKTSLKGNNQQSPPTFLVGFKTTELQLATSEYTPDYPMLIESTGWIIVKDLSTADKDRISYQNPLAKIMPINE